MSDEYPQDTDGERERNYPGPGDIPGTALHRESCSIFDASRGLACDCDLFPGLTTVDVPPRPGPAYKLDWFPHD